jgi:hypothetical protein
MATETSLFEEIKKYAIIGGMVVSAMAWLDSRNEKIYQKMDDYHRAVVGLDKKVDIIEQDVMYLKQGLFSELLPNVRQVPPVNKTSEHVPLSFMNHSFLFFDEEQNNKILASL